MSPNSFWETDASVYFLLFYQHFADNTCSLWFKVFGCQLREMSPKRWYSCLKIPFISWPISETSTFVLLTSLHILEHVAFVYLKTPQLCYVHSNLQPARLSASQCLGTLISRKIWIHEQVFALYWLCFSAHYSLGLATVSGFESLGYNLWSLYFQLAFIPVWKIMCLNCASGFVEV